MKGPGEDATWREGIGSRRSVIFSLRNWTCALADRTGRWLCWWQLLSMQGKMTDRKRRTKGVTKDGEQQMGKEFQRCLPTTHLWVDERTQIQKQSGILRLCRERWGPPTLNPPTPAQPSLTPSSPSAQPYLQIWSVESPSAESPAASLGLGGPVAQTMTVGSGRNMEVPGHWSTTFSLQPHPF